LRIRKDGFDFDFRKKIHGVFTAAINLGMAFLATETFDFADSHAEDADAVEGFLDVV